MVALKIARFAQGYEGLNFLLLVTPAEKVFKNGSPPATETCSDFMSF